MRTETRACQNCRKDFIIEPDDSAFYAKVKVPPPTLCPECRLQRRLVIMNERALYKRDCGLCGKNIVTMYAPESKFTVYCNPCWWSDKWDGTQYAREYDPSQPFLVQLKELNESTPQMALEVNYPTLVNSDYINHAATAKNCYLIFTADECENVLYSEILIHNKDSLDCTMFSYSELCCGLVTCGRCYRVFFSEDCENCQEVYFSKDLSNCSNCFGCAGIRNKNYHIFNEPFTKEEYKKRLEELNVGSYSNFEKLKEQARRFWLKAPRKFSHALRNANVTGDYVYGSKNSKDMYIIAEGAEDCRYCQIITMPPIKDCYDYTIWGNGAQRIYEAMIIGEGADSVKFSFQCWPNVREIEYSMFAISSAHLFGCANFRNKQYCILNKQYSPEEYEKLRKRIIEDMDKNPYVDPQGRAYRYGEFLPVELSPFGYNESYAADFFPLSREEALEKGFNWYVPEPNPHKPTIIAEQISDHISDVQDSILQAIIECARCKSPFRIIAAELALLRKFGLPVSRQCPACRYKERFSRINPPRLWMRECGKCGAPIQTSYSSDRPEVVYCESCYNSEIL